MKTNRRFLLAASLVLAITFTLSCSSGDKDDGSPPAGGGCPNAVTTPVNAEGIGSVSCGDQTYKTVKIGAQVWMAENLNYDVNGSRCYNDDPSNCAIYGRLYNWATANIVCPSGWRLPSLAEWIILIKFVEPRCADSNASGSCSLASPKLKATDGWNDYEGQSGNGTDDYGFAALPGGYVYPDGSSRSVGDYGSWWSASDDDCGASCAYNWWIRSSNFCRANDEHKNNLFSVRCLQN